MLFEKAKNGEVTLELDTTQTRFQRNDNWTAERSSPNVSASNGAHLLNP
jgi:hypothetical protein